MKNKTIWIIVIAVIVVGGIYLVNKQKRVDLVAAEPNAGKSTGQQAGAANKEMCYYKATVGAESTDEAFASINYDPGDAVHGIINFIPGEKDSLVGTYTGTLEANNGMTGYPLRAHVVYNASGEGIVNKEEQYIAIGKDSIESAVSGDTYKDAAGVWRFKDASKITYGNELPLVDCSTVPDNVKKDYSTSQ